MSDSSHTLGDLLPGVDPAQAGVAISGLAFDSRRVGPGALFVAVPGAKADGLAFAADAASRGAAAIAGEGTRPAALPSHVAYHQVASARAALSHAAAARVRHRQPERVVAITGTSGKSSVADFTRQLLGALGFASASIGTLGVVKGDGTAYGSLTTPDPITLHHTLDQLEHEGVTDLAMEASSHGLEQHRLDGVRLKAAAFTNLGRDHLDYHPTVEDYLAAKLRLFTELLHPEQPAVINADGAFADQFVAAAKARRLKVFTTGRNGEALRLVGAQREGFTQKLKIGFLDDPEPVFRKLWATDIDFPLVGTFQVENAMVAAGLVIAAHDDLQPIDVIEKLPALIGVPGRMERVGEVNGALCIVDYAHKPDALAHVLDSLRPFATGRLICVFGCGGDRDRGKRPLMGAIAAERADLAVVTDDNPRSEDPASIRAAILAAAPGAREIGDRAEAIREAVRLAQPGDVIVVAGKGHETGQIVGERTLPFSDHDVVRAAITEFAK